jgi:protein-S-isoprenylcysteine O-methyltransferase Ste14
MSRPAVGALFAVFTAGTAMQLAQRVDDALAHPELRAWLVVAFWMLKLGIVAAFAFFVVVRPPARRPAREPLAFAACAAAIAGAVALRGPADGPTATLLAGDVVALAGAAWLLASVLALGRCFGFLPEARGLVTRGPYRLVRHPVYLGEIVAALGLLLTRPHLVTLALLAVFALFQYWRTIFEERALATAYPNDYSIYRARVPRLVPRWR